MACPVSHIVYTKKYFEAVEEGKLSGEFNDKTSGGLNRDEFIAGSVFPDIRRIDKSIKRRDTHMILENLDLNFAYLDSFNAGWKFHLYCDMKREEILNRYDFYSLEGAGDCWNLAAKFLEDEIIYEKYRNWEKIHYYFDDIQYFENSIHVSRETFELWYAMIAKYVEKQPDSRKIGAFISKQPSLAENASGIIGSVDKLRKNAKVVELLSKVVDEIV